MQDYGKALRKLRRHFNMTQKELADKLSVTAQTVSKWENGVNHIDIMYLNDLSALFGISVDEFLRIADGQALESVLSGSGEEVVSAAPSEVNAPTAAPVVSNGRAVNVDGAAARPQSERIKAFFKNNLPAVVTAIVLFFVIIALTITTVCVTNVSLTANQIYEKVNPSVFYIEVTTAEGKQAGSGFFIDKNGTAVTNYHVIKGGNNATITLPDGNKYDVEQVLGCDTLRDLVLLKVNIGRSVPVERGDSDKLKTGDKVYAIGYPESFILGSEDSTFTDGIISKPAYNIDGVNYIQTTADMTHGNSGGVLINSEGKVVGITTGKIDVGGVSYMNLALPVNNIVGLKSDINLPLNQFSSVYRDVTVKYMAGDEVFSQKTLTNGTKAPQTSGERSGYSFEGWFEDEEFLIPFDFNKPIDGDTTIYGKWTELPHFTVTYTFGDNVYSTAKVYEGDYVSEISYSLSGYIFGGWYSDPQLTVPFDFNKKADGDVTVYGKRTPITYFIVFEPNGGTGEAERMQAVFGESVTMPECTFTYQGYKFAGWRNVYLYQAGETVQKNFTYIEGAEVVFKAEWERATYTLIFDVDGGSIPNHYQPYYNDCGYDEVRELPSTPTRNGYTFNGWSINGKTYSADQSVKISAIADSSNTIAVKALWQAKEYTIRYIIDLDDDGIIVKQQTCKVGESVTLLSNVDELPAGYYLIKWYNWSGSGSKNLSLGQVVTHTDLGTYGEEVVTLYADWGVITYKVECVDGVTGESYGVIEAYYGQEISYSSLNNKPYKKGYNYTWQLYNDDGTPYTGAEGKITTEAGKTVIAKTVYEPITYTLSFMMGDVYQGYKEIANVTLKYDEEFILPEEYCISETGFTFLYFKEINTAVESYVAGDTIKNLTVSDGDDVWLYLYQRKNTYSITFDPNGGSGEMPIQSAICADEITINKNAFVKEGYFFTGWECGEEEYADGGTINKLLDEGTVITLVARWQKNLEGEGTELSPYEVASYEDLVTMALMVEMSEPLSKAHYALTADIDCQTQSLKAIGGSTNPFGGVFDGRNHIISNATFERTGDYIGLFGNVQLGTLKNFGIKNFQMTGGETAKYCGAVAGIYTSDKVIENVFAKGTVNLSFNFGTNTVAGVHVGGFVGSLTGSAKNCYFEGNVSASTKSSGLNTSICTGGFAGSLYGNNLEIDGVNYSISPDIFCCYVNSNVTVNSGNGSYIRYRMGGFVGVISTTGYEQVTLEYCVSIGDVKNINTSSTGFYGGFAGQNSAEADLSLVRRDAASVCEGKGTACAEVLQEDLLKLKNVQWLINEFGFDADIWADEYGLPMLKAYIKETV